MNNVVALILGGGRGARLYPLTKYRSKPAVPLAAKYRLIDIPLSNCLHSGIQKIYVLTQFNSVSLHRHIRETYRFDYFGGGFVEVLAAQQTTDTSDWYQGTADAVRQNLRYIEQFDADYVLVLSGDQLYSMNFAEMLATHLDAQAEVTIAAKPVGCQEASNFGVMKVNGVGRVIGFLEKPRTNEEIDMVRTSPTWIDTQGINSGGRDCIASMGIYLFSRDCLVQALKKTDYQDFGKEVFPASIRSKHVQVHLFDRYWEDIGTIRSFYNANLALARRTPEVQLLSRDAQIYTRPRFLPPTRVEDGTVRQSLIADGCTIESGVLIENSIIGLRCRIGCGVKIRNSVLMGADDYEKIDDVVAKKGSEVPRLGIGEDAVIEGAIVDKNCCIGKGVRIVNVKNERNWDASNGCLVRDGVVIVERDAVLVDGWKLR